jgi:hypothetical protein
MEIKSVDARLLQKGVKRQPCEVWTRVMGYHRPVSEFNPGKKSEHAERTHFTEPASLREQVCCA